MLQSHDSHMISHDSHMILHGSHMMVSITSICIFRWLLKEESKVRKMERESSNTWGKWETPFLDSATQRYCFTPPMKTSSVRKTGPEFWMMERRSSRERSLERSSWDLWVRGKRGEGGGRDGGGREGERRKREGEGGREGGREGGMMVQPRVKGNKSCYCEGELT